MRSLFLAGMIFMYALMGTGYAQERPFGFLISGNLAVPLADFGKSIHDDTKITARHGFQLGDKIGLAGTGYGARIELTRSLGSNRFEWTFGASLLINSSITKYIELEFNEQAIDSVNLDFQMGEWINLPVLAGIRYSLPLSHNIDLVGSVRGGLNFSRAPSLKAVLPNVTVEQTTYEFSQDFGFEFGLGLEISDKVMIGFRYLDLSTPSYEGTRVLSEKFFKDLRYRQNSILAEERSISMLTVDLSYYLF